MIHILDINVGLLPESIHIRYIQSADQQKFALWYMFKTIATCKTQYHYSGNRVSIKLAFHLNASFWTHSTRIVCIYLNRIMFPVIRFIPTVPLTLVPLASSSSYYLFFKEVIAFKMTCTRKKTMPSKEKAVPSIIASWIIAMSWVH